MGRRLIAGIAAALAALAAPQAAAIVFEPPAITGWRAHSFGGQTEYLLGTRDKWQAVHAKCRNAASGLVLEIPISLHTTPIIEWRWRVDTPKTAGPSETTKPGDDFAARLYVVRDGGVMMWRTRALSYVWTTAMQKGQHWPNPFTDNARMIALRNANDMGAWHTERRNLREDFRRYHGIDVDEVHAIAIMTDCDNGKGVAEAWYGRIRLLTGD
jgi:hypothetical protein